MVKKGEEKMRKIIQTIILLFAATIVLMPAINAYNPEPESTFYEGDLITIDIDRGWDEEEGCYCTIEVHNNDQDKTITTNFYCALWQDSLDPETGRYLGNVSVTEDLSPAESFITDPIYFSWEEGGHWLIAIADSEFDVIESYEGNNLRWEWFRNLIEQ